MTAVLGSAPPQAGPDGSTGSRRRTWWTLGLLLLGVLAVVAVIWGLVQVSGGADRTETTVDRATDPNGLRAFVLLVESFGGEVRTGPADGLVDDGPDTDADVVLVLPGVDLASSEWADIDRWQTQRGGTLVDATTEFGVVPLGGSASGAVLERGADCAEPFLRDVDAVELTDFDGLVEGGGGGEPCFVPDRTRDLGYVVVWRFDVGGGPVVLLGGAGPFTNAKLDAADNAVLATSLFAPVPGTTTLIVRGADGLPTGTGVQDGGPGSGPGGGGGEREGEASGGSSEDGSSPDGEDDDGLADLLPVGVRYGLLQLLVALVLYALWRARRVGAPVPEPLPVEIEGSELVAAVGDLLARRASPAEAAALIRADALRDAAGRLGLPRGAAVETVIDAVCRRTGQDPDDVRSLLAGPPVNDPDALVHLARRLDQLREEILHGTRA